MGLKARIAIPYAKWVGRAVMRRAMDPARTQQTVLRKLLDKGASAVFGTDHRFAHVQDHAGLVDAVPVRDYEELRPYIDRVVAGEPDVLWPGRPKYLCKTSGTTSGAKFIPITQDSLPDHIAGARRALLAYIAHTGNTGFINGRMIFLQGSPELDRSGAIPTGRLSGIVADHVPSYLQKNRLPSRATNTITDWETKVEAIVGETIGEDMRLISGIPPWVQMYFERLLERSGKATIKELFPDFSLLVHGGVNFTPYQNRLFSLIGEQVDTVELFPASEGFIAYQDRCDQSGLLLMLDRGIYFEFIPTQDLGKPEQRRLSIEQVEVGENYAMVLHTNAGLWGYSLGDTVRFISLEPPRILVTGRTKHFTSAFGEHVIAEEVEGALLEAQTLFPCEISEFTVAPRTIPPNDGLPYHEWFIEFAAPPTEPDRFAAAIDAALQKRNPYYKDLITGKVLRPLVIRPVTRGGFAAMMKAHGMNDAQSKVPRLSNTRELVGFFESV